MPNRDPRPEGDFREGKRELPVKEVPFVLTIGWSNETQELRPDSMPPARAPGLRTCAPPRGKVRC